MKFVKFIALEVLHFTLVGGCMIDMTSLLLKNM